MGADKSAENTPNAPNIFGPICLPKPKSLRFSKKSSLWVSLVRGSDYLSNKYLGRRKGRKCFIKTNSPKAH